jgi:hypothetical protein
MNFQILPRSILVIHVTLLLAASTQAAGPLVGWGYNEFGQIDVPAGTYIAVAAGSYHSLAIRADGTLVGWGYNGDQQINVPPGTFTAITTSSNHNLGVCPSNTFFLLGRPSEGTFDVQKVGI